MKILPPFLTTYLCEFGFSTFLLLKNKLRNKLDVKSDLRLALVQSIAHRFDMILIKKLSHLQVSNWTVLKLIGTVIPINMTDIGESFIT